MTPLARIVTQHVSASTSAGTSPPAPLVTSHVSADSPTPVRQLWPLAPLAAALLVNQHLSASTSPPALRVSSLVLAGTSRDDTSRAAPPRLEVSAGAGRA